MRLPNWTSRVMLAATMQPCPSLFSIPPTRPFVDALAQGLLAEVTDDPARLADMLVLLPTRRACRALREAFLRVTEGKALILPEMRPIGDIDEDEILITTGGDTELTVHDLLDIPPAIDPLKRRFLLSALISRLPQSAGPDRDLHLADELARLLDQVQTEELSLDGLDRLVPASLADHWAMTVEFLNILRDHWPNLLAAHDAMDPAARRALITRKQAALWQENPPERDIVVAGSTGSIPATADLMVTIAHLPRGRIVLPGLDRNLSDEDWQAVASDPAHPQYGLARLLNRFECARDDVLDWSSRDGTEDGPHDEPSIASPAPMGDLFTAETARPAEDPASLPTAPLSRIRLMSEAMRPARTTERWRDLKPATADRPGTIGPDALHDLILIEAPNAGAEADAIALLLREALETEAKTAALITPDRALGRRVAATLERWGIAVDDSAGKSLALTPAGVFFRLVAEAAESGLAPYALLALLKHPLAGLGLAPERLRREVRYLERTILRGPRPAKGSAGLRDALRINADNPRTGRIDTSRVTALIDRIADALDPLVAALTPGRGLIASSVLSTHIAAAEAIAATDAEGGDARLWRGEDGEGLAEHLGDALRHADLLPELGSGDYTGFLDALMVGQSVRPKYGLHPRLFIWGPLEARLQHADTVILGGLNEGVWPPEPDSDPWMSRPMRRDFGLPAHERRIGLSAHDFVQAMAAPRVVLSRSAKVDGAPQVPSRWLERLDIVCRRLALDLGAARRAGDAYLAWTRSFSQSPAIPPIVRPMPRPPVESRPRKLSVTRIEKWLEDPYAIYAEFILNLKRLDEIDAELGPAERGTIIHKALEDFVRAHPAGDLPDDAYRHLLDLGEKAFGDMMARPEIKRFWWPRFQRAARWVVETERNRRETLAQAIVEETGSMEVSGPGGPFTLTAKADRIDLMTDGTYAVIDYKTGNLPSKKDLESGYKPQLPLEAAMIQDGGFKSLQPGPVVRLELWKLSGGDPPGEERPMNGLDVETVASEAKEGLIRLVQAFDRIDTPYGAIPRPAHAPRFNDYDHLARVLEWSVASVGEDG